MTGSSTVLFTTQNADLFTELQRQRPDVALVAIGSTIPTLDPNGKVWCFVDFLLPEISGLEMCRRLRSNPATAQSRITIIFESPDKELILRALHAGVDDYIVGHLSVDEVLRRIEDATPTSQVPKEQIILGDIIIEPFAHRVRYQGKRVNLAPNEFQLLLHFAQSPDRVFSRDDLIHSLGKTSGKIESRTADVWIGRLRRAFKKAGAPEIIRTVRPLGYVFEIP